MSTLRMTSAAARWRVLLAKEMLEMARSYKLVWVPVVFVLLGVMQPVTSYFLPELLAGAGNLPEGSVIEIPMPSGAEVLSQTLQQYNTLGLLLAALSFMTAISGEKSSGTAALMLVKPVTSSAFVTSKWAAMTLVLLASYLLGYGSAWYYTELLIGAVHAGPAIGGMLIYGLWLVCVGTLTLLFSALLRSGAGAAFAALGLAAVLSIASSVWTEALAWSPGSLAGRAYAQVLGNAEAALWPAVAVTAIVIAALLAAASYALRAKLSRE